MREAAANRAYRHCDGDQIFGRFAKAIGGRIGHGGQLLAAPMKVPGEVSVPGRSYKAIAAWGARRHGGGSASYFQPR